MDDDTLAGVTAVCFDLKEAREEIEQLKAELEKARAWSRLWKMAAKDYRGFYAASQRRLVVLLEELHEARS